MRPIVMGTTAVADAPCDRRPAPRPRRVDLLLAASATCSSTPGPESSVETLLEALGGEPRARILLTHIHFDHAGATGRAGRALARLRGLGPRARRAAHGRPRAPGRERHAGSTATTWSACGARSCRCPRSACTCSRAARRSATWRVAYTPGHASHHVSYLHEPSGIAFVGDVGRRAHRRRPDDPADAAARHRPRAWHESVDRVAGWGPSARRSPTSARSTTSPRRRRPCTTGSTAGARWRATPTPRPTSARSSPRCIAASIRPRAEAFLQAMPPFTLYPGLERYWAKKNG